jgi:hypothetical protein
MTQIAQIQMDAEEGTKVLGSVARPSAESEESEESVSAVLRRDYTSSQGGA